MASLSPSPPADTNGVQPYCMHVSQRYLDLTKRKLELTRLPRQPKSTHHWDCGVDKTSLEPLVDHWLESYEWRTQERFFNDTLPQYRISIGGTRLHFVHKRSPSLDAIPLLFVHGWPESFISVSSMINSLCDPVLTPPVGDETMPAFHVIVPSIPGFAFSDALPEAGNNMRTTADVFVALMRGLGYNQFIVHGSGWGFEISRLIALRHPGHCVAIHTVNPEVPAPSYQSPDCEMGSSPTHQQQRSPQAAISQPITPEIYQRTEERPQTTAYGLCDSPAGLLAHILDALKPTPTKQTAPALDFSNIQNPWTPTAILNYTMLYWLPGPEVALRWLVNSASLSPALWTTYSNVLLGISHFHDNNVPSTGTGACPPQWAEAYHRVAFVRRREGRVRFPAQERPHDLVSDIRELARAVMCRGLTEAGVELEGRTVTMRDVLAE